MNHQASLRKSKEFEVKPPAPVVPLRTAGDKRGKQPGKLKGVPLYHNERIFKPKKHDPL